MRNKFTSSSVIEMLSKAPADSPVKVMVRPTERDVGVKKSVIDPKNFKTSAEYRSKLIENQKARLNPGKEALIAKAHKLGLSASAAESINAVLVEGHPQKVLDLLKDEDIQSAAVEKPISF